MVDTHTGRNMSDAAAITNKPGRSKPATPPKPSLSANSRLISSVRGTAAIHSSAVTYRTTTPWTAESAQKPGRVEPIKPIVQLTSDMTSHKAQEFKPIRVTKVPPPLPCKPPKGQRSTPADLEKNTHYKSHSGQQEIDPSVNSNFVKTERSPENNFKCKSSPKVPPKPKVCRKTLCSEANSSVKIENSNHGAENISNQHKTNDRSEKMSDTPITESGTKKGNEECPHANGTAQEADSNSPVCESSKTVAMMIKPPRLKKLKKKKVPTATLR